MAFADPFGSDLHLLGVKVGRALHRQVVDTRGRCIGIAYGNRMRARALRRGLHRPICPLQQAIPLQKLDNGRF